MKECICKRLRECDKQHKAKVVLKEEKSYRDFYGEEWIREGATMEINHNETTLKPYAFIVAGRTYRKGHKENAYGGVIIYIKHCPFCGEKLWGEEE